MSIVASLSPDDAFHLCALQLSSPDDQRNPPRRRILISASFLGLARNLDTVGNANTNLSMMTSQEDALKRRKFLITGLGSSLEGNGDDQLRNLERNRAAQASRSRRPHDSTATKSFEHGCGCGFRVLIMSLTRVMVVAPDSRTSSFQLSDAVHQLYC